MLALYIIISLTNVFLHIVRSIMVIKSGKLTASLANCVCYTFSVHKRDGSFCVFCKDFKEK